MLSRLLKEIILSFIGYATIMGAAIKAPYMLQEMAHMFYPWPELNNRQPWDAALISLDTEFNKDDDEDILERAGPDDSMWWNLKELPDRVDPWDVARQGDNYILEVHLINFSITLFH
jgi:hypothetical protein